MLENLKNRRSIRKYKPEQIADAELDAYYAELDAKYK